MLHFTGDSAEPAVLRGGGWREFVARVLGLAWLLMWMGCATPARPVRSTETLALVVVENRTDFEWRVSLMPVADATTSPAWRMVKPREIAEFALNPGVYQVKREIVTDGEAGAPRPTVNEGVALTLSAGRTYTWPLATLFSNDGVER